MCSEFGRGRRGAFDGVARELAVDRSVLRRRMQSLDDWFGVALLEGRGTAKRPTAAGQRLLEQARRILDLAERLRSDVAAERERLVVACTGTVTTELLPHVLVEFERRERPIQLVVRRAGGAACERLVENAEADLGVVRSTEPPRGFESRHLSDDRLWFVLPARHPLSAEPRPSLGEMAAVPLVIYGESSRTRARVMERLGPLGAAIRVEVENRSAALEYVRAGVGATFLSLLPGHAPGGRRVCARDVTALFGRSRFYVIWRRDRRSDTVLADATEMLCRRIDPKSVVL